MALFGGKKKPLNLIGAIVAFCGLLTLELWLSTRFEIINACLQIKLFLFSGFITAVISVVMTVVIQYGWKLLKKCKY